MQLHAADWTAAASALLLADITHNAASAFHFNQPASMSKGYSRARSRARPQALESSRTARAYAAQSSAGHMHASDQLIEIAIEHRYRPWRIK